MADFSFRYPEWREVEPATWLSRWADRFKTWDAKHGNRDNGTYFELVAKGSNLTAEDFERLGQWKEQCWEPNLGRWKSGTPAAYDVWMQAKAELPTRPPESALESFLSCWSHKQFLAGKRKDGQPLRQTFGLSRATTLLHVISGGDYPIMDAVVVEAMARLGSPVRNTEEAVGYLNSFCPLFFELAARCGASGMEGRRRLDNALMMYGSADLFRSPSN